MKCPVCSAEIAPDALACPACGAFQSVERTPLGVVAGWVGILTAVLTAMVLVPLPVMLLAGGSLTGFPWVLPLIGLILAGASLGYSKSTRHTVWLAPKQKR